MKEIGGYIELDTYHLPMLHEGALALNCGRNALAYILKTKKIKKLWIPKLICDSIPRVCEREGVSYSFYRIGMDFLPKEEIKLKSDEWLYFINYYSQFDNSIIKRYVEYYKRVIVDQVQSYYQQPISGVDTLYSCRKYFGVSDGAFLYSDEQLKEDLPIDESYERMRFLLGRFERTASEFYQDYINNNDLFYTEPIKKMSKLTYNFLHGIDYERTKKVRINNYMYLHNALHGINKLRLNDSGTFMYPLYIQNGNQIRRELQKKKKYIPTLWPDVYNWCTNNDEEYQIVQDVLPLPIDQRYGIIELSNLVEEILQCMKD